MGKVTHRVTPKQGAEAYIIKRRRKCTIARTNTTTIIDTGRQKWIVSEKHISFAALNFLMKVKRYATEVGLPQQPYTAADILYIKNQPVRNGIYTDLVEVDVNAAYWNLAHKFGYLSDEIYREGLDADKVPKVARLISLGALATTRRVYDYDGNLAGKLELREVINNPVTTSYFFHVAKALDDIMRGVFDRLPVGSKLFYWVDAFFVRREVAAAVVAELAAHGLECKTMQIPRMEVIRDTRTGGQRLEVTVIKRDKHGREKARVKKFFRGNEESKAKLLSEAKAERKRIFEELPPQ